MNAKRQIIAPPVEQLAAGGAVAAGGPVAALHQALSEALVDSPQAGVVLLPPGNVERLIAGCSRLAGPVMLAMAATTLIWVLG